MDGNGRQPTHRLVTDLMRHLVRGDEGLAIEVLSGNRSALQDILLVLEQSRLSGYFYLLIVDTPMTAMFPAGALERLQGSHRRQAEGNQRNLELLRQIQRALDAASIPFLTLKGLYLAQRFFGDASRRFMWDIDILVHLDDLEQGTGHHYPPAAGTSAQGTT